MNLPMSMVSPINSTGPKSLRGLGQGERESRDCAKKNAKNSD